MRRPTVLVTAVCAVLAVASCAGPERSEGPEGPPPPAPTTSHGGTTGKAAPKPSAVASSDTDEAVARATEQMLAAAKGANSPAAPGLLVAAESTGGALFVWETSDGRFCHGAAKTVGATLVGCNSHPDTPPVRKEPRLVPLVRMMATGWNVVFGAEHETVESVSCGDRPVPVRDVGVMADGRRTVHSIEFPDLTFGTVTVRVKRGSRVVTESLALYPSEEAGTQNRPSCRPAGNQGGPG